jgi:hypothetical protein
MTKHQPFGGRGTYDEEGWQPRRAPRQFWRTARYRLTFEEFFTKLREEADFDIDEADKLWRKVAKDTAACADLFDAAEQRFLRNVMEQLQCLTYRQQRKVHWCWCETI